MRKILKYFSKLTISQSFAIQCTLLQCYLISLSRYDHNYSFLFHLIILPLGVISIFYWYNRYIVASTLLCLYLCISVGINVMPFDFDARYNTTKSNLSQLRAIVKNYRKHNSKYPIPRISSSMHNSKINTHSFMTILSQFQEIRPSQNYNRGILYGELITNPQGNSFICVVTSLKDYQTDQSDLKNCYNTNLSTTNQHEGGGYLYYPKEGLLRLNFKVNGDSIIAKQQSNVGELFSDWTNWSNKNLDLSQDYPVQW